MTSDHSVTINFSDPDYFVNPYPILSEVREKNPIYQDVDEDNIKWLQLLNLRGMEHFPLRVKWA